ncbi:hypothetical protein CHS0354_011635 [Potamilus streckersoni]|uniref:Uncharacterized protein n=1 Tax=Potamilus streckersoni TaxID=2493646 RepID=A0AAE0TKB1_9BIVA|nr:hypothetical protein CHS0354_011635 [Potamilus streckersoni]
MAHMSIPITGIFLKFLTSVIYLALLSALHIMFATQAHINLYPKKSYICKYTNVFYMHMPQSVINRKKQLSCTYFLHDDRCRPASRHIDRAYTVSPTIAQHCVHTKNNSALGLKSKHLSSKQYSGI